MGQPLWKILSVPQKLDVELPYDPTVLFLGMYPRKQTSTWAPPLAYPFFHLWTFRLFLPLGCCKEYCQEHWCIDICLSLCFPIFSPRSETAGSSSSSVFVSFSVLRNCHYCFSQLHHFTFPPAMSRGSRISTSLPTLAIHVLSYNSHPDGCEVCISIWFAFAFSN